MSAVLEAIGTFTTAVWTWFATTLDAIETAISTSVLLQIGLGVGGVFLGFKLLKKGIGLVKGMFSGGK